MIRDRRSSHSPRRRRVASVIQSRSCSSVGLRRSPNRRNRCSGACSSDRSSPPRFRSCVASRSRTKPTSPWTASNAADAVDTETTSRRRRSKDRETRASPAIEFSCRVNAARSVQLPTTTMRDSGLLSSIRIATSAGQDRSQYSTNPAGCVRNTSRRSSEIASSGRTPVSR